jgi:hypothetical protein
MIEILETLIGQYCAFRNYILWGMVAVFLCILITGIFYCKENRRYHINKLLQKFVYTVIFAGIGGLLYFLGMKPSIEYNYFNIVVFVFVVGTIILNGIVQMIIFRKIVTPVVQVCTYIQYTVYFEIFLLAVSCHLEAIEWLTGTLAIWGCYVSITMLESLNRNGEEEEISKQSDYPNSDLYATRVRQLDKFVEILKQQKGEPYAVMISGEWGMGKSSFAKALEKRLNNDYFIWVHAGSEKSVSDVMTDIAGKILEKMKISNIYIENSDLIENYFAAFSDLLEESGLNFFNKVAKQFGIIKDDDSRDYLNGKLCELSRLGKTIYLIIDDLDRCDEGYRAKMFKVIRESTDLVNCKTIFLVDKKVFLNKEYDSNYIEKYISYTLDLCRVDCHEIIDFHIDEILSDDFWDKLNITLLKNRNTAEIQAMIRNFPQSAADMCRNEIIRVEEEFEKKNTKQQENEKGIVIAKIKDLTDTINEIEKNICNSRKIKNYLKGIKRDMSNLSIEIDGCSGEFKNEDWIKGIIEVQFVKNILTEIFTDIKMCTSIEEFGKKYKGYSLDVIFGLYLGVWYHNEKKEAVLNSIIYNLDVIDFLYIKTQKEKYLAELHGSRADIRNINEYIEYVQSYDDLYMVLEICKTQNFNGDADKEKFLAKILECLSKQSSPFKTYEKEFLSFSKCLIDWAATSELSEKGKRICSQAGYLIVERCIIDNSLQFRKILSVFFPITRVEDIWHSLAISHIDEFFMELKEIDKDSKFNGLEDETDKLASIKKYYWNLEVELQKEKYEDIRLDTEEIFRNIHLVFEICQFWSEVEDIINQKRDRITAEFEQYFDVFGYSVKENIFSDIGNLLRGMETLKMYYEEKKECYKSDYSLFLLRLSYKMIRKYESEPERFGDKREEVNSILTEIAEMVNVLDKKCDRCTNDTIDLISIYVYRFKEYCEQSE